MTKEVEKRSREKRGWKKEKKGWKKEVEKKRLKKRGWKKEVEKKGSKKEVEKELEKKRFKKRGWKKSFKDEVGKWIWEQIERKKDICSCWAANWLLVSKSFAEKNEAQNDEN